MPGTLVAFARHRPKRHIVQATDRRRGRRDTATEEGTRSGGEAAQERGARGGTDRGAGCCDEGDGADR